MGFRGDWMQHQQKCWTCKKALFGCDWSRYFKPIPGWDAEMVILNEGEPDEDYTWDIKNCPEFELEDVTCDGCTFHETPFKSVYRCMNCAYHPDHRGVGGPLKETN